MSSISLDVIAKFNIFALLNLFIVFLSYRTDVETTEQIRWKELSVFMWKHYLITLYSIQLNFYKFEKPNPFTIPYPLKWIGRQ